MSLYMHRHAHTPLLPTEGKAHKPQSKLSRIFLHHFVFMYLLNQQPEKRNNVFTLVEAPSWKKNWYKEP